MIIHLNNKVFKCIIINDIVTSITVIIIIRNWKVDQNVRKKYCN
jgi:hypothetical protein